ncbi:MAG: mechanosensitive ion channel domain-containing protein, partial [Pseudomonadota bacterium]
FFLLLLRVRSHLLHLIDEIAQKTRKVRTDRVTYTIEALLYTAFAASVWPSLFVGLGSRWQLLALPEQARAVVTVMPSIGYTLAIAGFVMLLSAPNGVGTQHLLWSPTRQRIWPRAFLLLQTLWLPLFAISSITDAQSHTHIQASLGRLAFAASSGVLAYLFAMILHPTKGLPANALAAHPDGWASRLRRVWYPLAIAIPLVLALEAMAGYGYAAHLLTRCVLETVLLFFGGMLVFDLLERWLRVTRRRYRYEQILERRAASADASTTQEAGEGAGEREAPVDPEEIDIGEFDDQTRRLMSTIVIILLVFGCWFIWSKALPVLGVLDRLALWSQSAGEDGAQIVDVVTAADGLIALLTVFLVALATRNLPSLLEFAVLKNLPLDAGSRYAIRSVSQYLMVGVGVMLVAAELGVAWTRVQWLVAALSVGLGFGLQEIFANFVSGLIILLERPVRVGDMVTVGGVSGTVTRIRIRATTITDLDNKEVIVPNKTFITGQLVNWTLTTEMTRVVIPVGVAYGSDLEQAMKAMMDAAKSSPLVLDDPPPRVLFTAFGASSLDFEVYLYCRVLGDRLAARHEVLLMIERALGEAGIEIPFPQRDVHLHHVNAPPAPAPSPTPHLSASAASTPDPSGS